MVRKGAQGLITVGKRLHAAALDAAFAHHGDYVDELTGYDLKGARWYAPKLGRFLSEDPLGFADGGNPYKFAGNDPSAFVLPRAALGLRTARPAALAPHRHHPSRLPAEFAEHGRRLQRRPRKGEYPHSFRSFPSSRSKTAAGGGTSASRYRELISRSSSLAVASSIWARL